MFFKYFLIIFLLKFNYFLSANEQEIGWFFYHDDSEEIITEDRLPLNQKEAHLKMIDIRRDIEEKRHLAVLNPTIENLKAFLTAQNNSLKIASKFSHSWKKALSYAPELDPKVLNPTGFAANLMHKNMQQKIAEEIFEDKLKSYTFLLFYTSQCQYCDVMFATLSRIKGLKFIPVSLDNSLKYPETLPYSNLGITLPINITPYVWVLDSEQNLTPICAGIKDEEIFKRLVLEMTNENQGGF